MRAAFLLPAFVVERPCSKLSGRNDAGSDLIRFKQALDSFNRVFDDNGGALSSEAVVSCRACVSFIKQHRATHISKEPPDWYIAIDFSANFTPVAWYRRGMSTEKILAIDNFAGEKQPHKTKNQIATEGWHPKTDTKVTKYIRASDIGMRFGNEVHRIAEIGKTEDIRKFCDDADRVAMMKLLLDRTERYHPHIIYSELMFKFETNVKRNFRYGDVEARYIVKIMRGHVVHLQAHCHEKSYAMEDAVRNAHHAGYAISRIVVVGGFADPPCLQQYLIEQKDRISRDLNTSLELCFPQPGKSATGVATGAILRATSKANDPSRTPCQSIDMVRHVPCNSNSNEYTDEIVPWGTCTPEHARNTTRNMCSRIGLRKPDYGSHERKFRAALKHHRPDQSRPEQTKPRRTNRAPLDCRCCNVWSTTSLPSLSSPHQRPNTRLLARRDGTRSHQTRPDQTRPAHHLPIKKVPQPLPLSITRHSSASHAFHSI
ncbi:hypothetical protein SVAN01_02560 [Stagonosporopsis vannaccii]|nr:hypothetical protein SVAN01_02560 [Stagonosporopsis vannaccii]